MDEDRRERAHRLLDQWLDHFDLFEAAEDEHRSGGARLVLIEGAETISAICGQDLVQCAYRDEPEDRAGVLRTIATRIVTAQSLFGSVDTKNEGWSLYRVAEEIRMIALGDEPIIFAKTSERRVNARVAIAKMRALEWDAYLGELGKVGPLRHSAIAQAFGGEWDTISRWGTRSVVPAVGSELLDKVLRWARVAARSQIPLLGMRPHETWQTALVRDGRMYQEANRASTNLRVVGSDDAGASRPDEMIQSHPDG